jgi:3-methyladenine DNA glycosylase Tag
MARISARATFMMVCEKAGAHGHVSTIIWEKKISTMNNIYNRLTLPSLAAGLSWATSRMMVDDIEEV